MIPAAVTGGVKGYRLHQLIVGSIKGTITAVLAPCKGRQCAFRSHIEIGRLPNLIVPDIQVHQLVLLHHQERVADVVAVGVGGRRIAAGLYAFQIHQVRTGKVRLL